MHQRTLASAIETAMPMQLSLMTRQQLAPQAPRDPQGQKRTLQRQQLDSWNLKQPRTDKIAWLFKHPTSQKQFCFNWNSGGCSETCPMDREHTCAFPGCTKKDCRAMMHSNGFRPQLGGKGAGSSKGRGKS